MLMRYSWILIAAVVAALLATTSAAETAEAHAALVRSDPAAGASLGTPPSAIRMWFAEPLETSYTGADLLDAQGNPVAGAAAAIAPRDDQELILTPPPDLPDGPYTVAWRTLSAADGHTMSGYFGFRVGAGTASGFVPTAASPGDETARTLSRGLALVGLASLLAIAPVILIVLDPVSRSVPSLDRTLWPALRRYAVVAAALALVTSGAALATQAVAINPGSGIVAATRQTLIQTRYGQLCILRLLLLLLEIAAVVAALWGPPRRRIRLLPLAAAVGVLAPLPFSLLSHAAAEPEGEGTAVAADALHVLAAAVWGGGLLLLAAVLVPALRARPPAERAAALRVALPRFSIIGVAAWAILVLSGLYAAWLHVGTLEALRTTAYGQTLLLKGAVLLPILALAAFHLALGWRGPSGNDPPRATRTVAAEALLLVVVLLVVGRLIGLEPARTVLASEQPTRLVVPLVFETPDGTRSARLTVAPGATGVNTFTLEVDGAPLPDGSEGVVRFVLPAQDIGRQELRLPRVGANRLSAEGASLALAGDWQLTVLVRKIGAFSWTTQTSLAVGDTPPAAPQANPAPLFTPAGIVGMVAVAIGLAGLSAAGLARWAAARRRLGVTAIGAAALIAGVALLAGSRLPSVEPEPALARSLPSVAASPSPEASPVGHTHAVPGAASATPTSLAGIGTPVIQGDLVVTVAAEPTSSGPTEITVEVCNPDGSPVSHARVVLFAEMPGMGKAGEGVTAEEVAPGRYVARDVPLTMAGEWRVTVRVSPRGQPTQSIPVALTVS